MFSHNLTLVLLITLVYRKGDLVMQATITKVTVGYIFCRGTNGILYKADCSKLPRKPISDDIIEGPYVKGFVRAEKFGI